MGLLSSSRSDTNIHNRADNDTISTGDYREAEYIDGNIQLGGGSFDNISIENSDFGAINGALGVVGTITDRMFNYIDNEGERFNTALQNSNNSASNAINSVNRIVSNALQTKTGFNPNNMVYAVLGLGGILAFKRYMKW